MLIAVLERRAEIGLRRALGATRSHIAVQFLGEAVLLAAIGGVAGCVLGGGLTIAFASRTTGASICRLAVRRRHRAAMLVGTVSGAYPAVRASRMPPMESLRTG